MENNIVPKVRSKQFEKARKILGSLEGAFVDLSGGRPDVFITKVDSLHPGNYISLHANKSEECWLETNNQHVQYYPAMCGAPSHLNYVWDIPFNPSKHARKDKNLRFAINIKGIRPYNPKSSD